jgi:hypothetical protein
LNDFLVFGTNFGTIFSFWDEFLNDVLVLGQIFDAIFFNFENGPKRRRPILKMEQKIDFEILKWNKKSTSEF